MPALERPGRPIGWLILAALTAGLIYLKGEAEG